MGSSGTTNQLSMPYDPFCAITMSLRLREPTHSSTVTMTNPIDTS